MGGARATILYTDPPWALGRCGPELARFGVEREVLGDGVELRVGPAEEGRYLLDGEELRSLCRGCDALVVQRCRVREELLDAAGDRLQVVARQGVGVDNLNAPLLASRSVRSFNVPDYCVDEVAVHTMALLLAVERQIVPQHTGLAGGRFDVYRGGVPRRLSDRTAGVVGFGRIGRAVAQRLRLFYGRVLAHDPYVSADLMAGSGVGAAGFDELLATADCVLLHCPLNGETAGMIGAAALARVKPGAILVNCARGGLVDGRALYEALAGGRLAGAGLDVFSPEDPNQDEWYARILGLEQAVVTSHRAFLSAESELSVRRRVAGAIRTLLDTGELPPTVARVT
jgi:phosphoglycerate dehydrogenase-like enzyme